MRVKLQPGSGLGSAFALKSGEGVRVAPVLEVGIMMMRKITAAIAVFLLLSASAVKAAGNVEKGEGAIAEIRESMPDVGDDPIRGITEIAQPKGPVLATIPVTNPTSTPSPSSCRSSPISAVRWIPSSESLPTGLFRLSVLSLGAIAGTVATTSRCVLGTRAGRPVPCCPSRPCRPDRSAVRQPG